MSPEISKYDWLRLVIVSPCGRGLFVCIQCDQFPPGNFSLIRFLNSFYNREKTGEKFFKGETLQSGNRLGSKTPKRFSINNIPSQTSSSSNNKEELQPHLGDEISNVDFADHQFLKFQSLSSPRTPITSSVSFSTSGTKEESLVLSKYPWRRHNLINISENNTETHRTYGNKYHGNMNYGHAYGQIPFSQVPQYYYPGSWSQANHVSRRNLIY